MTRGQLLLIEALKEIQAECRDNLADVTKALHRNLEQCDHKDTDGKFTIVNNICTICGK